MRERSNVSDCSGNVSRHNGLLTGSDQPHVIRHRAVNVVGQVGNPIVADGNRERDEAVAIFLRIVKDGEIGEFSNERLKKGTKGRLLIPGTWVLKEIVRVAFG